LHAICQYQPPSSALYTREPSKVLDDVTIIAS
jgi:hypothetical protein